MSENDKEQLNLTKETEVENLFSDISSEEEKSENRIKRRLSRSRSRSKSRSEDEDKHFVMKNGCCRDCMKAFSKSGKSCLCQVPKIERKYILSDKGCNYCGCHGKNIFLIIHK